jgi:hypothetical protein
MTWVYRRQQNAQTMPADALWNMMAACYIGLDTGEVCTLDLSTPMNQLVQCNDLS